ncbi:MAG: hypothetical protein OES79_10320 [Planctomycetota bacterium]|nr:hypothetical protein [Planctomycetota bacterium]
MSNFTVVVAPVAVEKIAQYGNYIAEQSRSVEVAQRWVDRVYDAIETLEVFPRRFALAEEDAHRSYEIRRLIFGIDRCKQHLGVLASPRYIYRTTEAQKGHDRLEQKSSELFD